MHRVLIVCGLLLSFVIALAIMSFAEKPMDYDKTMKSAPNYNLSMAAMNDLVRSVNALGGDINVVNGKVSIKLSFTGEQARMLEETIENNQKMAMENTGSSKLQWDTDYDYYTDRANYANRFLHGAEEREGMEGYGMNTGMANGTMGNGMNTETMMNGSICGGTGTMMGIVPMNMEVDGKCPKCGAKMNFNIKCDIGMMGPMGNKGMMNGRGYGNGMDEESTEYGNKPCGCK